MKIVCTGGGTMGSVSPLIGICEELKMQDENLEVLWVGTKNGPEKDFLRKYSFTYKTVIVGKRRQYFSMLNIFAPLLVFLGMIQSIFMIRKFEPQVVLTAGSFVSVPVAYAAKFLKIPVIVHQQDLEKGLANKLMTKLATKITISVDESKKDFPADKVVLTSNPSRKDLFSGNKERGLKYFKLDPGLPTILIYGGGQGAVKINEMILKKIDLLTEKYQIIHLTGKGKKISPRFPARFEGDQLTKINSRYRDFEFLNKEIFDAYAVADLVVSRAGFSSLTELSSLGKAALVIPLLGHQELNAQYFAKQNAVRVLSQENLTENSLFQTIDSMMQNPGDLANLSRNISQIIDKDAAKKYVEVIKEVVNVKKEQ